jgi:hypothetical protein
LDGGSPAGGGSPGSGLSGTRVGGSLTGGFFRRSGGSCLGAGGFFAAAAWRPKTLVVCAGYREATESFICIPAVVNRKRRGYLGLTKHSHIALRFTHLEVIDDLLDAVNPGS